MKTPEFAREAVAAEARYGKQLVAARSGIAEALATGEMEIGALVADVAVSRRIPQTVVHTALSQMLRRRQLKDAGGVRVALA